MQAHGIRGRRWDPAILALGANELAGGYGQDEAPCTRCERAKEGARRPPDYHLTSLLATFPTLTVMSGMAGGVVVVVVVVVVVAFMFVFVFQLADMGVVIVLFAGYSADRDFPPRSL